MATEKQVNYALALQNEVSWVIKLNKSYSKNELRELSHYEISPIIEYLLKLHEKYKFDINEVKNEIIANQCEIY